MRSHVLKTYNATPAEIVELLAYTEPVGDRHSVDSPLPVPLPPEAHVAAWVEYGAIAKDLGVFETLRQRLVQLQFPIAAGISQTEAYQAATRRGVPVDPAVAGSGLVLQHPDQLELIIYPSLAGAIPVLIARSRSDFVALVQALAMRNEPQPIPDSMGACIVAGFNNWDRLHHYRTQWAAAYPSGGSEREWAEEFRRIIPQKERYQDRFIILSEGPYSGVPAAELGLPETEWQRLSRTIRLEHECTHYLTRRLLGSMRNHVLDELIADYRGIVAAIGYYRADWFLRFMGLESFPAYRDGGRLQNYRGQPPLSPGAFHILGALVRAAAANLERFDAQQSLDRQCPEHQAALIRSLTELTLEELAIEDVLIHLRDTIRVFPGQCSDRKSIITD